MNQQKIILESLSMELRRVALGMHRGSLAMARRFQEEALKREQELERSKLDSYLKKLTEKVKKTLLNKSDNHLAEDFLMYSILFQNYTQKRFQIDN